MPSRQYLLPGYVKIVDATMYARADPDRPIPYGLMQRPVDSGVYRDVIK